MYGMMGIQRLLENVMFLAALCTAVAPAGHSYFPLVVLAGEGTIGTTTPPLDPGDSVCAVNALFSPCRGGAAWGPQP